MTIDELVKKITALEIDKRLKLLEKLKEKMCLRCGADTAESQCMCDYESPYYDG